MKYQILTYGCQMNISDSERIATVLEKSGYEPTSKIDEADLIVVNMCSVRQSAVDRVFGLAKKFRKLKIEKQPFGESVSRPGKLKIVLTGCILKKDKKKFEKIFDEVVNIEDLIRETRPKHSNDFSAFLPIMTGCNNFCAYCVVPYTRGREISRPAKKIICEIKNLIKRGYKEIWLLGQNVNSYKDKNINFPKLLKMVNDIPGEFWVRFTSPHPKNFSDELIDVMEKSKKYGHYLNLPVQSGDDKVLKKMNRFYTVAQYKNLVKKIRSKIPDISLSTDIIVGFPGETKKQFENSVKLFKEIKFDMAYIAEYSPRSDTAASKMEDNVPDREKNGRKKVLNEILKKTALEKNEEYIGKTVEALIMEHKTYNIKHFFIGKIREYKTIKIQSNKNLLGKFVKVKIISALPWGLKGKLC